MTMRKLRSFLSQAIPALNPAQGIITRLPRSLAAVAVLGSLAACGGVSDQIPAGDFTPPPIEWQLVFEDEFEGDALDQSKWNIDLGDGCPDLCGWGNNELQEYTAENISVAGGVLTIQGREETDGSFTSARINTRGKFDFRYGRVEVSARLPEGQGTWPAIWLLHSDPDVYGPWPASGEIDIMEAFNLGVDGNTATQSTTHYGLPTPPFTGTLSRNDTEVSPSLAFHEYTVEWERDTLRFFVDGVHFQTQKASNWYAYFPADADGFYDPLGAFKQGPRDAPFDQLFHLIINFAIGGNPVGDPDSSTVWPQNMEIDYVRVYECINANPDTGRGCGTADASVVPLKDNDGNALQDVETEQPYVERLDLYVDGPEVLELTVGAETSTNTLSVNGFTGEGASVINDPLFADPDDPENTVWHVAVSGGVANAYLQSQDLADDTLLDTGFDFSGNRRTGPGGDPVGELAFAMKVNSIDPGTRLLIKLDSGFPNLGEVVIPESELAIGEWKTYSVKFDMFLANPGFVDCCGGTGVDLANVVNPFVIEVQNGAADVYVDDIRVTNACKVVGACGADMRTKGVPDLVVFDDAVNLGVWDNGIRASDSGSGFTDYTDPSNPANKVNWAIVADDDPERGQVVEVTFNDSSAFGVWFIQSSGATDANAYSAGAVVFDIKVTDYGSNTAGMTFKVDCFFPCGSGDKNLGPIADGVWETVTYPVSQLTSTGLDLSSVNTGIVVFPTTQAGGITFRLDNIRWVADTGSLPLSQIDLPVTFDDPLVDYTVIDFEGASTVVGDDPQAAGNKVGITTKNAGAATFAGTVIGTGTGFANPIPFAPGETEMSVRVLSPAANVPVLLKVENADATVAYEVLVSTVGANEWETLTFDFGTVGIDTNATFVQAIIFFDFGQTGDGATYYWDDLRFGAAPPLSQIDLPVTFEDANTDYTLIDFAGAGTAIGNDPITAGNTVAITTKGNGAQTFAGTVMGTGAGFATPIPFSDGNTTMSVRVLSPAANIPVMLKVENADASVFAEVFVDTTQANAWETLEFDFSTSLQGIDQTVTYVQAVIFFDFGQAGTGATYYWDDVQFVAPPPAPQMVFDEAIDPAWEVGPAGADDSSGFARYTDGTNPANKSNWAIVDSGDPTHGQVIDITFNDTTAFGVWFIATDVGVDLSAYQNGNLVFDIQVLDYGSNADGMTIKADCFFPCTSNDKPIGRVGDGAWETVSYPVSDLVLTGLDLTKVNTGLVIFPNFGQQQGGIRFWLDNIRWEP